MPNGLILKEKKRVTETEIRSQMMGTRKRMKDIKSILQLNIKAFLLATLTKTKTNSLVAFEGGSLQVS